MIISRDTLSKRMDLQLNDPQITGKEIEYDGEGRLDALTLHCTDGEKFRYRVRMERAELWDALRDLVPAEKEACPF